MKTLPNNALYRWITPFLIFSFIMTSIQVPPARAIDVENLLANPSQADPFTTNVPTLREGLFEIIHKKEMSIINRHVKETGVPWYDSSGEVYTNHPRYEQATKEFSQAWKNHMDKGRTLDRAMRKKGMNQVLNRAKEMAKNDSANINWAKEFKPSGTDPWKGRGPYTDMEYTGTDRANRYVQKAFREKNMPVSATPGQSNTKIKGWDMEMWGEPGKGKVHRMYEAENREFAKSASPMGQKGILYDKQTAALESLKKAHLERHPAAPGSWQEYQRMNDLVKAVERGEQNVLGGKATSSGHRKLHGIRSMKTDPVSAGLRKLGDKKGLQTPEALAFEKSQMKRLSNILKGGENANKTFISDLNKMIKKAETGGNVELANELKNYKNQSLQRQIFLRKALVNKMGIRRFASAVEGTEFQIARHPDEGVTTGFQDPNGHVATKLELTQRYSEMIKQIEANQAAGKMVKYRNRATGEIMTDTQMLEKARNIVQNLNEGKLTKAVKGTEYKIVHGKGKGGQIMYRKGKGGKAITEVKLRGKYLNDPIRKLRKEMSGLGIKKTGGASSFAKDFSFKGVDRKAFKPFKRIDLPKVKEGVLPPARAKNIKLVYKYAKVAEEFLQKKYPQLGRTPQGAFWLADPAEALEEYVLEAERKMAKRPEILKAFKAAKRGILRNYVRRHIEHHVDAVKMAQEEYVKAANERSILRARKMARDAEFNDALKKLMLTLLAASKLVDFMRTWYDQGFKALKQKVASFILIEIPIIIALGKGIGIFMASLTMNAPTCAVIAQGILAYYGAKAVAMMVFSVASGVTYMTTDYFILDENRQTLVKSLFPQPPERKNPWDFWEWLAKERKIDIEKNPEEIVDFLMSPESPWATTIGDIEIYSTWMVKNYRKWLLEKYEYIRRLDYFKDDPKVWSVITNELAKAIWFKNQSMQLADAQEEVAREQKEIEDNFFTSPAEYDYPPREAIITSVMLNGMPVHGYFSDFEGGGHYAFKVPNQMVLKAGENLDVTVDYTIFALPSDQMKINIVPYYEEGYSVYSEQEQSTRGGFPYDGEVTADEEFGIAHGTATMSLPLQYPTDNLPNEKDKFYDSKLHFEMRVDQEFIFSSALINPIFVEGPGTNYNGVGNLKVTVEIEDEVRDGWLPRAKVTLEPLSGQKAPEPMIQPYNYSFNFQNIPLGRYRVIAEIQKEGDRTETPKPKDSSKKVGFPYSFGIATILFGKDAFAKEAAEGGKGTAEVLMFLSRPYKAQIPVEQRHAGDFEVEVVIGKFKQEDFFRPKTKTDLTSWNIFATVQDKLRKPVIGAKVYTMDTDRRQGIEVGDGQYLLKGLPIMNKVTVRAEVNTKLMRSIGTKQYFGDTEVTFNNSSQENMTIVISDYTQYKWTISGRAQYSDGTPIRLKAGDVFKITMGGEENSPKTVSGLSYSFGPFHVPPDSNADKPELDSNHRGFRAEIKRGGNMIAIASATVSRRGSSSTEYNIQFNSALKQVIDPDLKPKDLPSFVPPKLPSWVPRKPGGSGEKVTTGGYQPSWVGGKKGGGTGKKTETHSSIDTEKKDDDRFKEKEQRKGPKRSYEDCAKELCPMCNFLFGKRVDSNALGGEDACDRCLKQKAAEIKRCMEGY